MRKIFSKKYSLDDLKKSLNNNLESNTINERKSITILIIDDDGYEVDRLIRLGYKDIKVIDEFLDMRDVENYDIIMCDINGVYKDVSSIYQGAALAALIKETFPQKYVVIFSSKPQKPDMYKYTSKVDNFIMKNCDINDLAFSFDKYIKEKNDPIYIWESTRLRLVENGVSTEIISNLEHYYVSSFLKKKDYSNQLLSIKVDCKKIAYDVCIGLAVEIIKRRFGI